MNLSFENKVALVIRAGSGTGLAAFWILRHPRGTRSRSVRTGQGELADRVLGMRRRFCHGSTGGLKNRRIFGCTIVAQLLPNRVVCTEVGHPI
jgi:hypothetical protein